MKQIVAKQTLALLAVVMLGAAADRWLGSPIRSVESDSTDFHGAFLTTSRHSSRQPLAAHPARFIDRHNTAAVWTDWAKEFAGKDVSAVRTALERALEAPLSDKNRPWEDPGRPRLEALVELLLIRQRPEIATDLLVRQPHRIGPNLFMRAFRAHYQKDPATAQALAATLLGDRWNDLAWLEREEAMGIPPPPPPAPVDGEPSTAHANGMRSWEWTLPDPLAETEACLAALDALPANERFRIIRGMHNSPGGVGSPVSNFWEDHPEIAARFVERMPSGANERGNEVRTVASAWARVEPEKALAWLESLEDFAGTQWAYHPVMKAYAEKDPQAAAAWIAAHPPDRRSEPAAQAVASHWACEDPRAALAWAKSLPDAELRRKALQAGLVQWGFDDGTQALAFVLDEPVGEERERMLNAVFLSLGQTDFDAAWQEVQKLEGDEKTNALRGMLQHAISSSEAEDLGPLMDAYNAYVATEPAKPPSYVFEPIVNEFAQTMAQQDAPRAVEWAFSLPPGHARDSSINGAFYGWALQDPLSAAETLATLPPGPDRDTAIAAAFEGLNRRDPERAFQWALAAESSETQWDLSKKAVRSWQGDPDILRQAVETAPDVHPEVRERLFQALTEAR